MASRTVSVGSAPQSTFRFFLQELKPKGKLLTPFNIISVPIIVAGLVIGKPMGIFAASFLAVRLRIAALPFR